MKIVAIKSQEILDSRGNPTVETELILDTGHKSRASVPSGASTGSYEALEIRDHDKKRYLGKGVNKAVNNVNQIIGPKLIGQKAEEQEVIDQIMLDLDGTKDKSNLGANAILSVSIACVKAVAQSLKIPTYQYIATLFGYSNQHHLLPIPMMNVLNGGKHAIGASDMQEFMIVPIGAPNIQEAIRYGAEVFHTLGKILHQNNLPTTVGDEGGYAPSLSSNRKPIELILTAIEQAGYQPGKDIAIALDPASSEFFQDGIYKLKTENKNLTTQEMVTLYKKWIEEFPIISIEDGFAEDDWQGFSDLVKMTNNQIQIVGDDIFVTNPERLQKGIELKAGNSILIKLNQIGTVSETIKTIMMAKKAGMSAIVSHRSGETEDDFIADFVVGAGTGQIKTGSLCRSERIAKYNQLMRIERELENMGKIATFPFIAKY